MLNLENLKIRDSESGGFMSRKWAFSLFNSESRYYLQQPVPLLPSSHSQSYFWIAFLSHVTYKNMCSNCAKAMLASLQKEKKRSFSCSIISCNCMLSFLFKCPMGLNSEAYRYVPYPRHPK